MDYKVISYGAIYKDGEQTERGARWSLEEIGLSREGAIASMVTCAMRHVEWRGTILLQEILQGRTDPEQPYLVNDENSGIYLWFCIAREDAPAPALPNAR